VSAQIFQLTPAERQQMDDSAKKAFVAITKIALDMPEGPINQSALLNALMRAYQEGRLHDEC
jgi:hypothetical protein